MSTRRRTAWSGICALVLVFGIVAGADGAVQERAARHLEEAVQNGVTAEDFHHLVALEMSGELLEDALWLETALDRLGAAPTPDPLMVSAVRQLRMEVAKRRGRPQAARELFRADGGLERWWAAGPFPLEELDEFTAGPAAPDLRSTQWRSAPGTDPQGWLRLSGLGWPARRQLIYLATTVRSTARQPVAVRLGFAEAARVWLNGETLADLPYPVARGADQLAVGGWLRAGSNLLVVAVGCERDDWWLRARLTAPDGSALDGVTETGQAPAMNDAGEGQLEPEDPLPAPTVRTLHDQLEELVAADRSAATAALAAVAVTRPWFAATDGTARELCRQARRQAPALARILELRLPNEPSARGELAEEVVAAEPEWVRARIERARWLARRDLRLQALEVIEPVTASSPAARAVAVDVATGGWPALALPKLEETASAAPRCVLVQTILARRALDSGRVMVAEEALARLTQIVPGDGGVATLQRELFERCGDANALAEVIAEHIDRDPNWPRERVRLARLSMAADDPSGAEQVLAEGVRRCPLHPELTVELAGVEHHRGDDDAARSRLEELLDVRPQELRAARLLELLGGEEDEPTWTRSADELREMAGEVAATNGEAVGLLEHHEIRFLPAMLTEQRVQRALLVVAAEQAQRLRRLTVAHVPERQRLRVLSARLLRADGSEVSGLQSDTPRLRDPALNIYYDTRLRVVEFPELEDGDIVELTYVLSETAEANETGAYRGGLLPLAWAQPVRTVELELSAEDARELPSWELVGGLEPVARDVREPGRVRMSWRNVPSRPVEDPPPPQLMVLPHLVYSNHPEWGSLAEWYRRHVALRMLPSADVEDRVHRLTDGLEDRADKIAAIYRWVADEISYVSLALGEHRFRPFSADWVVRHTVGDCKDTASLLVAMLSVIDVPARIVLVRTADLGPPVSTMAALELFNHAIAYLPEDDLWLDGTAAGHTWQIPPGMDQMATVLVIDGPSSAPEQIPVVGAGVRSRELQLRAAEPGSVQLTVRAQDTGDAASQLRARLAGRNDPTVLAGWLQELFPGAEVVGEPKTSIRSGQDPVQVEVEGRVPRSALRAGGGVPLFPGGLDELNRYRPSDRRRTPMLIPVTPQFTWRLEVDLDRQPSLVPESRTMTSPFGVLDLHIESTVTAVIVEGRLALTPGVVAASEASELRDFLLGVERALDRRLEVP